MTLKLKQTALGARGSGPKPEDFGDGFFIAEIQTQCRFVEIYSAMFIEIYNLSPTDLSLQAAAHSILVAASNVAKILSVPKKCSEKRKRRAIRLQQLLNCTESDFTAIVNARNYLEHFDERIDRYLEDGQIGGLALRVVSNEFHEFAELEGWGRTKVRYLQHLNTDSVELTLVDEKINVGLVVDQADEINSRAKAWLDVYYQK